MHLVNESTFMMEQIILGPSVLNSFTNFRKHVLDFDLQIFFSGCNISLALLEDSINELFIFDDHLNHFSRPFVALYEVDDNIIGQRELLKQV